MVVFPLPCIFFFPPPFFLSFFFFFLMRRVTSWNTRGANFARAEIARARENKTARARKLSQRENYGPRLPFVNDTAWNINLGLVDPIIFHWITWFFIEKKKGKKIVFNRVLKFFLKYIFFLSSFFFLERVRRKVRFHRSHFFFFKGNFFGLQMSVRGYRSVNYSNEIPLAICFLEIEFERNY